MFLGPHLWTVAVLQQIHQLIPGDSEGLGSNTRTHAHDLKPRHR